MERPEFYVELPAGVTRRIRVNKDFLRNGISARYIVQEQINGSWVDHLYWELQCPDGFIMACERAPGNGQYCGGPQMAWVETTGRLWVD